MHKYLTEFIGTFFLVLTICLAVEKSPAMAPLAIGASLMVMVYMGGHVSGGHYNPAVSLAALIRGALSLSDFVPYVLAQVAGALVAAYTGYVILTKTTEIKPGDAYVELWNLVLLVEILYTFALALVVLNAATSDKTKGNSFYGLAIGFVVVVGAFAGGSISGGAFNPAVGTGLTVINAIVGETAGNVGYRYLWYYLVGPLIGGVLAALVFKFQDAGLASTSTAK
jgi:aquaporin Z